ncbi:EEIG1/EHBP1 N-terminal domain-containing protein [Tanacetum coccineum]
MACSIPHNDDEIQALVQKQIDEDMVHQKAILDLALQFDNACTTKEDLRKAYEKCGSSLQTHEIGGVYLTAEELHQLHLDEEALRETLEEQTMDKMQTGEKRAKLLKEKVFILDSGWGFNVDTRLYAENVEDVVEDADIIQWARKLEQVVAIVKSCSPNALGDLNVTLKDLSGTIPRIIHYKVLDVGSYENDITVGVAMILANVSVFTPKPSKHYLNITKRNVVEVFRKNTVSIA